MFGLSNIRFFRVGSTLMVRADNGHGWTSFPARQLPGVLYRRVVR